MRIRLVVLPLLLLSGHAAAGEPAGTLWRAALPGYRYQFPRDHFAHPEFRTEWWYYTGNVAAAGGHRYGFELVFFRQGQRRGPSDNASAWRADDVYLAHLALTDIDRGAFRNYERLNRAGPGVAGASFEERRIWNGNWEARWNDHAGTQTLTAIAEGIRFSLRLSPEKPPVIHGREGVSQKAGGAGKASHYVSFTRLSVQGTLNGISVCGTAWMDHEWFTHQLEAGQQGWDWFSVQLNDRTELMLFQLRRKDGSIDPWSAGTWVDPSGTSRTLARGDFSLTPLEWWNSPKTGARYPIRWRLSVPSLNVSLECTATSPAQELTGGTSYWEGTVAYTGTARGVGYLEMTGYAQPVKLD